jgi:GNAT superfamily N-acetyltransferase
MDAPTLPIDESESRKRKADEIESEADAEEKKEAPLVEVASEVPTKTGADATHNNTNRNNPYKTLKYCLVENDGTHDNLVKLVGLKSLFAKQLPKMPRPYIARLVFDRRHKSLAILSDDPQHKGGDEEIIGAICYRGFEDMRFAEIAFCAVNASHQVKGYGTKLMNLLKQHAVSEGIEYFITFADNFAVGYFQVRTRSMGCSIRGVRDLFSFFLSKLTSYTSIFFTLLLYSTTETRIYQEHYHAQGSLQGTH